MTPLLEVSQLSIFIKQNQTSIPLVKGINFTIAYGECVGLVGESGCGKSMTALTLACLGDHAFEGKIKLDGQYIHDSSNEERRETRATKIGMIFQDPQIYLNPTLSIGQQILEVKGHQGKLKKSDVYRHMESVGLQQVDRLYSCYPHELSGGMCQRVMIAMAMARQPKLLIADEPTTALDCTVQAQIVDLIKELQASHQMGTLLITHDFNVVERLCNKVLVMYAGEIVEMGSVKDVLTNPRHPYTQALISCRPQLGKGKNQVLKIIPGTPPPLLQTSHGCPFSSRCPAKIPHCDSHKPILTGKLEHQAACWQEDGSK